MSARPKIKGKGWHCYYLEKQGRQTTGRWMLRYRRGPNDWPSHRIPPKYQRQDDVRRYAKAWLDERRKMAREGTPPQQPKPHRKGVLEPSMTLSEFAEMWWSGELARQYPGYIHIKVSARSDKCRLKKHVLPVIGGRAICDFEGLQGKQLARSVMAALPALGKISQNSRRHVAQVMHRLLTLAAEPVGILSANPLQKGFVPRAGKRKAMAYLYPAEERKLLACKKVPLINRLYYGILAREGLRAQEAREARISDVDLKHGMFVLDRSKTGDRRSWPLAPGVGEALKRWLKRHRPKAKPHDLLLLDEHGKRPPGDNAASALRDDLKLAGVRRPQLYVNNGDRRHICLHDLRATFVTVSLANGATEKDVRRRTGHKSSQMLAKYDREVANHKELNLGKLEHLANAIPELADEES